MMRLRFLCLFGGGPVLDRDIFPVHLPEGADPRTIDLTAVDLEDDQRGAYNVFNEFVSGA
jgi:hypothetical protein